MNTDDFDYMISSAIKPPSIPKAMIPAEWMYERIINTINEFESKLPDDMQAGGRLISFGNTAFSIDNVGYWNPDMIIFYGTLPDNETALAGGKIELLQHVSQLNLLLTAVKRQDDLTKPRREIGFHSPEESQA